MKRVILSLLVLAIGSFLGASVRAGIDYNQYNASFKAQESKAATSNEGRSFQHKSKYQREQSAGNTLNTGNTSKKAPVNKYLNP